MNSGKLLLSAIIILAVCIWSTSCSHATKAAPRYRVKTETDTTGSPTVFNVDKHTYIYDAQGRISQDIDTFYRYNPGTATDSGTYIATYTYSSNIITTSIQGSGISPQQYYLNSSGLAVISTDPDTTTYTYDAQGYLTVRERRRPLFDVYETFINSNGNCIKQTKSVTGIDFVTDYSYNTGIDSRDFGKSFLGKRNTNIQTTSVTTCPTCAGSTKLVIHLFDSLGRTVYEHSDDLQYTNSYTYY